MEKTDKTILIDRLDCLAARLEDEGRYVDAMICVNAIAELDGATLVWDKAVERGWGRSDDDARGNPGE